MEIKTDDELYEENRKTRRKTHVLIRLIRILRDNPDMVALFFVMLFTCGVGYFAARIYLGLTATQIRTEAFEFVCFFVTMFAAIVSAIKKVCTQQGVISSAMSGRVTDAHDPSGNSIKPRQR